MTFLGAPGANSGFDFRGVQGGGVFDLLAADGEVELIPAPAAGRCRIPTVYLATDSGSMGFYNDGPDPVTVQLYWNTSLFKSDYAQSGGGSVGAVGSIGLQTLGLPILGNGTSIRAELTAGTGPVRIFNSYTDLPIEWVYFDVLAGANGTWAQVLGGPPVGFKRILFNLTGAGGLLHSLMQLNEDSNVQNASLRITNPNRQIDASLLALNQGTNLIFQSAQWGELSLANGETLEATTDNTFADNGVRVFGAYRDVPSLD